MRGIKSSALLLTAVLSASLVPLFAHAAEIIIKRDVPIRSAVHTAPPGQAITMRTERRDEIIGLVPDGQLLNDDQAAAVLGTSPMGSTGQNGAGGIQTYLDRPGADANSNIAASGMSTFSSLGGRISGEVGETVGNAMQNLSSTLSKVGQ
jgi:hypothetical protein